MRPLLQRVVRRTRRVLLGPLIERIDAFATDTSSRLDQLTKRVEEIEVVMQAIEERAATVTERSTAQTESQLRVTRRLEEIEKLLSER
ncbi:MAG: hypothetical protein M0Z30_00920 [Actinomycetota bacterium]|nr:hypothetical protein [Actinomycetota bacterium]